MRPSKGERPVTDTLVLVRHGQSEWNARNLFTGWRDPGLTARGREEAEAAARMLGARGLRFDVAFTSVLARAVETSRIILAALGQDELPVIRDAALNERDYGDLAGLNKDDARRTWGEEQVHLWRRSYAARPPGGESLQDTAGRVLPYYERAILPRVLNGERALVVAHGNSLRALVMRLDGLGEAEVAALDIPTGVPLLYELDGRGRVLGKEALAARPDD